MNRNQLNSLKQSIHQTVLNKQLLKENEYSNEPPGLQPGQDYPTTPIELPPFIKNPVPGSNWYNWETGQWIYENPDQWLLPYDPWMEGYDDPNMPGAPIKTPGYPGMEILPYYWWTPTFYGDDPMDEPYPFLFPSGENPYTPRYFD